MGKIKKKLVTRVGVLSTLAARALARPAMTTATVMVPPLRVSPAGNGEQHTVSISLPMTRCGDCHALVEMSNATMHAQWHMDEKQAEARLVDRINLLQAVITDHEGAIVELQDAADAPVVMPRPKKKNPEQGFVNTGGSTGLFQQQSPQWNSPAPKPTAETSEALKRFVEAGIVNLPKGAGAVTVIPPQREEVPTVDGLHYFGQMRGHALYRVPGTPEYLTCFECKGKWSVPQPNEVPRIESRCIA